MPNGPGSSWGCCCANGAPEKYAITLRVSNYGPPPGNCQQCVNMDGDVVIVEGSGPCNWMGVIGDPECGINPTDVILNTDTGREFSLAVAGALYSASNVKDCMKPITLSRTQNDIICNFASTLTAVPIAPAIPRIGDLDCVLTICPCPPIAGPSLGIDLCCYPNPNAPASPNCPCKCEPDAPLVLDAECGCVGIFCIRCPAGGCVCPQGQECCPCPEQQGGDCGCGCSSGGGGGGCTSGRCGSGSKQKPPCQCRRPNPCLGCPSSSSSSLDQAASLLKRLQGKLPQMPGWRSSSWVQLSHLNGSLWVRLAAPFSNAFDPPVILTYNSRSTEATEFGTGWTMLYRQKITELNATDVVCVPRAEIFAHLRA